MKHEAAETDRARPSGCESIPVLFLIHRLAGFASISTKRSATPFRSNPRPPSFRCVPFARDVAFDPGRASAPRIAVPHMLPSSE